ncbi:KxYKxGKxW signal peptide domain-containing protein [Levilactobacillus brevis]|uniref:mucin-binding protein n=1 Tax=Levilactobacillus brevis TaxID=1580 RepID=UPI001C1ECEB6|nr:KxYKxGKxW signal peptide domain-containing protein [Levilactobacillus brevis]MBU7540032.1 KxYKxGKxW signal peptide domain-containing protein [Levilactobacillus brevis]MBU7559574.1 KxYKxGKxW signal peptide domain-containing protein [Levilactobacillus brevis]MBU7566122.1 KxYKxGKxW signal peptide domain-containing protein [Levilactobacillus brevis]MCE6011146.1 KxYKxGKxW signal peptide domain-containing protein [Levilactobacillus brevis]MCE6013405.1 KxYKxGKxW signal peptide domain-containing pr
MRNRLNKMGLEGKTHYKLYKSGRNWIAAGITVFSVGMGLTFSQTDQVQAATNTSADEVENSATVSSSSPTETKNTVVLNASSAAATATAASKDDAAVATSATTTGDSQSTATSAASTSRAVSGAAMETTASDSAATQPTASNADSQSAENTRGSAASGTTSQTAASQESQQVAETTNNAVSAASSVTTATNTNAMPINSRIMKTAALASEAETKPTVSLVTTGTVSMDYGEASLADLESHISSPAETPANDVAYYIQDAAGNYLEDVNGNKVNLLYALFLDSADVNDYVDVVYTDEHGQVTKYSGDTDFSTLDQIGSYSVTINDAGKAAMSRVMKVYNAYDTSTSHMDDFVPTFSTGAADYTFTINIVPVKITATTGKNGLIILRPSQLYTGSLTMLPVVTVKNATKQNILQISNGEIGDAKPGVAGKVGQRILTLADFTYTYQGTEANLTGADTGQYTIILNDAGRKAVQAALGSNYILDDAATFTTTGTVKAADLGLTIVSDTVTYNGKPQGTTVAITAGTAYDHFDFITTTDTNVGTYDNLTYALADPTQAAILAKNYTVTTTDGTLVITPAELTVTVNDDNVVYNGRAQKTTATVTSGTNYDDLAFTAVAADGSGASAYTKVGTYAMTGTTAADTSNYKVSYVNGTLTIDPAKATITIPNQVYWADGTQKNLTAVVTGTVNGEALKYSVTNGMSAVGTKTITATPDANDSVNKNYTISVVPGTLTIGDITVKYLYEHVDADGQTQIDATEIGTATHATDAMATDYLTYTTVAKPKTGYALAPNTGLAYNGTLTDQGGTVTYLYLAKNATATVTYIDTTTGSVLHTENLTGMLDTQSSYQTADTIANYVKKGYVLVSDDYPTSGAIFSEDSANYTVRLAHATDVTAETKTVTQTVHYQDSTGKPLHADTVNTITFTRTKVADQVTGEVTYSDWSSSKGGNTFDVVSVPNVSGYRPDTTKIQAVMVTPTSADDVQTVTYSVAESDTGYDVVNPKVPGDPIAEPEPYVPFAGTKKVKAGDTGKLVNKQKVVKAGAAVQTAGKQTVKLSATKSVKPVKTQVDANRVNLTETKRLPQTGEAQSHTETAGLIGLGLATLLAGLGLGRNRRKED